MAQCVVCSTEIREDARFCPSCGAEQPKVQTAAGDDPLLGAIVARKFRIEKLLGVGGMGKVYKARQLSLDKAVVVKVLHDQFREDPQLVQRFQREARAASRLNHPNSIQIIDFGQDDTGVVFMAMEFLQGQDLFALLKRDGPLPPDRLARVMIQVCSALAEAHEQNVIHRDLKPENIMVEDRRGQRDYVKVLDFGIAKIQDPESTGQALTQAGMVCGTPEYMSPEQARGLVLDPRSDIYALGVVMYQLAVGELPFVSDTPIGIVTKHILEAPTPPRQRRPDIPAALDGIILKAMEKDPAARFSTVVELGEALERFLQETTTATAVPAAMVGSSSASSPPGSGHGTSVTPALQAPVLDASGPPRGRAGKIAALAGVAVLVVAGSAVALKDRLFGSSDLSDSGVVVAVVPPLVDAGLAAVAADAGRATILDGDRAPPAAMDAGTVTPLDKPPANKPPTDKPPTDKPPTDKPPDRPTTAASRAAAQAAFNKAANLFKQRKPTEKCSQELTNLLVQAGRKDPSFARPFWYIAQCMQVDGANACVAVDEFERRGGPKAQVQHLRRTACKP